MHRDRDKLKPVPGIPRQYYAGANAIFGKRVVLFPNDPKTRISEKHLPIAVIDRSGRATVADPADGIIVSAWPVARRVCAACEFWGEEAGKP